MAVEALPSQSSLLMLQQAVSVDESEEHLHPYEIDNPRQQITEKGYAITGVRHQVAAGDGAP